VCRPPPLPLLPSLNRLYEQCTQMLVQCQISCAMADFLGKVRSLVHWQKACALAVHNLAHSHTPTTATALPLCCCPQVVFSGWHTQIAAVCSSVPGCRRADGNTWGKTWLLPADQVNALQQALNENLVSGRRKCGTGR
jgi:hypothetical protein